MTVGEDPGAAVPADVVHRVDLPVIATDDDQGDRSEVDGDVVAGVGDLGFGGGEEPLGGEDPLDVEAEHCGVGVQGSFQGGPGRTLPEQFEHVLPHVGGG